MDHLTFNETDILERVDEYTLYCHYLGFEVIIGAKYPCPDGIRLSNGKPLDHNPSFGIFERRTGGNLPHEFLWKDQSYGYVGDIFDLVQRTIPGLKTRRDAILYIAAEFGFGGTFQGRTSIVGIHQRKYLDPVKISIKSKPWTTREYLYWDRGNVNAKILNAYYTYVLQCYWMTEAQVVPDIPKSMAFAYRIFDRYQLYFPYITDRSYRFRSDWTEACVPGWHQLQFNSDLCLITKSMKDIQCLRSFGYEAIACRGESVILPAQCIAALKKKYRRILVLFDNDGKHKGDEYEFEKIFVPKIVDTDKDPFDFCDNHGEVQCRKMLKSITYGY